MTKCITVRTDFDTILGDKEARQEFLRRHVPSQGRNGTGGIWREAPAEEIVREELAAKKWGKQRLAQEPKSHLWKETTMTAGWIGERLKLDALSLRVRSDEWKVRY